MSESDISRRELAAAALATGKTVVEAAAASEAGERTIHRWLAEDADFRARIDELRGQMVAQAAGLVVDALGEATSVLRALLTHTDPHVRYKAAAKLWDLA